MAWVINQDKNTGGWYVENTDTGVKYYAGDPGAAINDAIREGGMPASLRAGLLADAKAIVDQQNSTQPIASSGDIVGNANLARDEGANATRPPVGQEILTPTGRIEPDGSGSGTNATMTPTTVSNPTAGTDATVKTISQTQATPTSPANSAVPIPPNPFTSSVLGISNPGSAPVGGPGGAAPGDDQRGGNNPASNTTRSRLDALYAGESNGILPQDNVLDQYPSYTYSLSWYLVDPKAYNQILTSPKKDMNGYYLLVQSGGANLSTGIVNTGETGPLSGTSGRSPYFNLDYYIDNLVIDQSIAGSLDSAAPASYTTIEFTVTEPNGITLTRNLYAAVNDLYRSKGYATADVDVNYAAAIYCMAIRFYGYDETGKLIVPIARNDSITDRQAVVEKFVFFNLNDIGFSIGNRLVEYKIVGATPDTSIGLSSNRGTIPADYQFSGATVKDILVGQWQQQTTSQAAGDKVRNGVPVSPNAPVKVGDLTDRQQAAIAAGTDPNTVNDYGQAFGGGGL